MISWPAQEDDHGLSRTGGSTIAAATKGSQPCFGRHFDEMIMKPNEVVEAGAAHAVIVWERKSCYRKKSEVLVVRAQRYLHIDVGDSE